MRGRLLLVIALVLTFALPAWAQNRAPIADAGEDQQLYLGDVALLSGSAYDPDGDSITDWAWRMESKPTGSLAEVSDPDIPDPDFLPDVIGDYILTLTVSDGTDISQPDTIVISVAENLPPTAVIVADPTSGPAPLTVNFDGTQSSDPEGRELSYAWNFGDGTSPSAYSAPTHVYDFPGTYLASLKVTDDRGNYDRDSVIIEVAWPNNPPSISPSANPASGPAPLDVQFIANASDPEDDPLTFTWEFGDGNTSSAENPLHTYQAAGTYFAWLTASDGTNESSASVTVVVDPAVGFEVGSMSVKWQNEKKGFGKIHLEAYLDAPMPASGETLALLADGLTLFEAPFSDFHPDDDEPGVYVYKDRNVLVKFDSQAMTLQVFCHKILLYGLSAENGVTLELGWGDATAVTTVFLTSVPGDRMIYNAP